MSGTQGLCADPCFNRVTHLVFDADDTLWDDQGKLQDSERRLEELFDAHLGKRSDFRKKFIDIEHRNIPVIGYGFHSYLFSLAQSIFQEATPTTLHEPALQLVRELIEEFLHEPPRVFPQTQETLSALKARGYSLFIATRGIPGEQFEKIRRSGLEDMFDRVFVVAKKEVCTYQNLAREISVDPGMCCMIGNSLKSDVKPALAAGFCAIHIPEPNAWAHDMCTPIDARTAIALPSIKELLNVFKRDSKIIK